MKTRIIDVLKKFQPLTKRGIWVKINGANGNLNFIKFGDALSDLEEEGIIVSFEQDDKFLYKLVE